MSETPHACDAEHIQAQANAFDQVAAMWMSSHVLSLARADVTSKMKNDLANRKCLKCPSPDCADRAEFRRHGPMVSHFIQFHQADARNIFAHACFLCYIDCETENGKKEHDKAESHIKQQTKMHNKRKAETAADTVDVTDADSSKAPRLSCCDNEYFNKFSYDRHCMKFHPTGLLRFVAVLLLL